MCLFKDTVYIQCIIRMFYHAFNQTSHMRSSMSLVTCFHDINLLAYHRNMICKYQHCLLHSLVLCHCDLIYRLNSFVSVTVCYRSMPVITYVISIETVMRPCIELVLVRVNSRLQLLGLQVLQYSSHIDDANDDDDDDDDL